MRSGQPVREVVLRRSGRVTRVGWPAAMARRAGRASGGAFPWDPGPARRRHAPALKHGATGYEAGWKRAQARALRARRKPWRFLRVTRALVERCGKYPNGAPGGVG